MGVKILHAADFHMDSAFDALPEDKAAIRRREQRGLLEKIAQLAASEQVQLVLLAGDLLDSGVSYYETQEVLLRTLSQIRAQIVIAPGNHDYYCAKSPYAFLDFPENVHIFKSPAIKSIDFPDLGCRVWGAGFTGPLCPPLLEGFHTEGNGLQLMVLHGDVGGDSYNPIQERDIAASGLDYLALGHVHSFSGFRTAGTTTYAYPGCPEGRGFDETGVKGVIVGTVERGACDLHFAPLGGREYQILPVDLSESNSAADALLAAVGDGSAKDICRILLTGGYDGALHPERLTELICDKYFHVTIRNETHLRRDLWAGLEEETLRGIFLRLMRERYDAADSAGQGQILTAVRYGLAAIDNREEWRP